MEVEHFYTKEQLIAKIRELQITVAAQEKVIHDKRMWYKVRNNFESPQQRLSRREKGRIMMKILNNSIKLYDNEYYKKFNRDQIISLLSHNIDLTKELLKNNDPNFYEQKQIEDMSPTSLSTSEKVDG